MPYAWPYAAAAAPYWYSPYASQYASRMYGYPSAHPFPAMRYPQGVAKNPLTAGLQMGLVGAAIGLSPTAIHAMAGRKRTGGQTARDMLIGAFIGSGLGALSSIQQRRANQGGEVGSYADMQDYMEKEFSAIEKQGVVLTTAGIIAAIGFLANVGFAGWSAHDSYKAVQAAKQYDAAGMTAAANRARAAAAGHGALGAAEFVTLPGVSKIPWVAKLLTKLPWVARANKARQAAKVTTRGGKALRRAYAPVRWAGRTGAHIGVRAMGPDAVDARELGYQQLQRQLRDEGYDVDAFNKTVNTQPGVLSPQVRDKIVAQPPADPAAPKKPFTMSGALRRFGTEPMVPQFTVGDTSWAR